MNSVERTCEASRHRCLGQWVGGVGDQGQRGDAVSVENSDPPPNHAVQPTACAVAIQVNATVGVAPAGG